MRALPRAAPRAPEPRPRSSPRLSPAPKALPQLPRTAPAHSEQHSVRRRCADTCVWPAQDGYLYALILLERLIWRGVDFTLHSARPMFITAMTVSMKVQDDEVVYVDECSAYT